MLRRIFGVGNIQVLPVGAEDSTDVSSASRQTEPKQRRKSVPKIQPMSPKSGSSGFDEQGQHNMEQRDAGAEKVDEVILFLQKLQLDVTMTPLKRLREEDPRVQACFSHSVPGSHSARREMSAGVAHFEDFLEVLVYSPGNADQDEDQKHDVVLSALNTLHYFLDSSIALIRADAESLAPMSLANQAVALVDLMFQKMVDHVKTSKSGCITCPLPEIFRSLNSLWSVIELVDGNSKVIWSQALCTASTLLICCSSSISSSQQCKSNSREGGSGCTDSKCHETLAHLVSSVQSLSQCITVFRDICGFPISTSSTMQFWPVCHYALHSISLAFATGSIRESVAKSLSSNIYRALASSAPSPQELPALMHTLNTTYPSANVGFSEGDSNINRGPGVNSATTAMTSSTRQKKRRMSSASDTWSRVVYVLTGFQYLLHGSVGGDGHVQGSGGGVFKQHLTRAEEWLTGLGEALLLCLSPSAPSCLQQMGYTLAQYFFFVVLACHQHPQQQQRGLRDTEWIFSELSEYLQKFGSIWTKKQGYITRLRSVLVAHQGQQQGKLSGRPSSSQSNTNLNTGSNSSRATPPRKVNLHQPEVTTQIHSHSRTSPQLQAHAQPDAMFSAGDNIEGQCTVQNGSKRWFPGVVRHVSANQTYTVAFSDGELKENMTSGELRTVRVRGNRRVPLVSRGNSFLSSETLAEDSIRLPEFGSEAVPLSSSASESGGVAVEGMMRPTPVSVLVPASEVTGSEPALSPVHMSVSVPVTEPLTDRGDLLDSQSVGMLADEEVNMINSYDNGDDDDNADDNDDIIFAIPLVLARNDRDVSPLLHLPRSIAGSRSASNSIAGDNTSVHSAYIDENDANSNQLAKLRPGLIVPRMSLDNLDSGAALDRCVSTNSLSGALLREAKANSSEEIHSQFSPRTAIDKILHDIEKDDSTAATRLDSWRDSLGWNTRRSTDYLVAKSSSAGSLLSLAQSQLVQSKETQRMIHLTTAALAADLAAMREQSPTYEIIAAVLSFKTVLDLSMLEKESLLACRNLTKDVSQRDPYEDSSILQSSILMRPELNSGQCKLYMYAVREYLDSGASDHQLPFLSMSASQVGPCFFRLLKLCSTRFFEESCLPGHIMEEDKIGTGAFGSVHRVHCPFSCGRHGGGGDGEGGEGEGRKYAVKRMPRERSMQDEGVLFGVLTEVTCLEMMADHRGVCDIVNYGVHGGQYWMVLELGMCNLQEWAVEVVMQEKLIHNISGAPSGWKEQEKELQGQGSGVKLGDAVAEYCKSPSMKQSAGAVDSLLLKLSIFHEMVSILSDVHERNIIHFDIKCSNFMLRRFPQVDIFLHAALNSTSSGNLFLTDFGESLQVCEDMDVKLKQRSRGTLAIQSPEMLSVSESGTGLANNMKLGVGVESPDERMVENINTPGAASDCWSMACALFELLTGECLFEGQSFTEMFCLLCTEKFVLPNIASKLEMEGVGEGVEASEVAGEGGGGGESVDQTLESGCVAMLSGIMTQALVQSPIQRPPLSNLMASTIDVIKLLFPHSSQQKKVMGISIPGSAPEVERSGSEQKHEPYSPFVHLSSGSPFQNDLTDIVPEGRGECHEGAGEGDAATAPDVMAGGVGDVPPVSSSSCTGILSVSSAVACSKTCAEVADISTCVNSDTGTEIDDFLIVRNTSSHVPPLAKEFSNSTIISAMSTSISVMEWDKGRELDREKDRGRGVPSSTGGGGHVLAIARPSPQEEVHMSPGSWQFSRGVSLNVSESFSAHVVDSSTPTSMVSMYGDVNEQINDIIKIGTESVGAVADELDSIELQPRHRPFSSSARAMKKSLLLCLGRQIFYSPHTPSSPLDSFKPLRLTKVCHINVYMSEPESSSIKITEGIAHHKSGAIASTSSISQSTDPITSPPYPLLPATTETTLFETPNLCIYPCEITSDLHSAVEALKRALIYARSKCCEGFAVKVCLDSTPVLGTPSAAATAAYFTSQGPHVSTLPVPSGGVKESSTKVSVTRSGMTAAVLLSVLLRPHSTPTDEKRFFSTASETISQVEPVAYLEKHFPWALSLLDRQLFKGLMSLLTPAAMQ